MAANQTKTRTWELAHDEIEPWLDGFEDLHIDIGTGDGAFALRLARENPRLAVLGVDTCLGNLKKAGRRPPDNLRFLACDAMAMPEALHGRAWSVSINFPYGSLLRAVGVGNIALWSRLLAVARPDAQLDIRINASAGAQYGLTLEEMQRHVERMLRHAAPKSATVTILPQHELRSFPSTWAKRLAYGRSSQVLVASARMGL